MDTECGRPQRRIERRRFVVAGDRVGPVAERAPGRVMAAPVIRGRAVLQALSPAPTSTAPDAEGVGVGYGGGGGGVVAATGVRTTNAARSRRPGASIGRPRRRTTPRWSGSRCPARTTGRGWPPEPRQGGRRRPVSRLRRCQRRPRLGPGTGTSGCGEGGGPRGGA